MTCFARSPRLSRDTRARLLLCIAHPAIRAARLGDFNEMASILRRGPNLRGVVDDKHRTPLHLAALHGHEDVVALLRE